MSRILKEVHGKGCVRWNIPELAADGAASGGMEPLTAGQAEAFQKQAYEEGFELGRSEGQDAGRREMSGRADRLEQIMRSLTRPLEELDQEVEQAMLALSIAIARQLVRREIKADPGEIVAVVKEAISALPAASRDLRLSLHPEDARLVRELLTVPDGESAWKIIEDATLDRGDCLVFTDVSHIDASLESRLKNVVATLMGGERREDVPK